MGLEVSRAVVAVTLSANPLLQGFDADGGTRPFQNGTQFHGGIIYTGYESERNKVRYTSTGRISEGISKLGGMVDLYV